MPLQTLTDAELDMTVEEWIRYQISLGEMEKGNWCGLRFRQRRLRDH